MRATRLGGLLLVSRRRQIVGELWTPSARSPCSTSLPFTVGCFDVTTDVNATRPNELPGTPTARSRPPPTDEQLLPAVGDSILPSRHQDPIRPIVPPRIWPPSLPSAALLPDSDASSTASTPAASFSRHLRLTAFYFPVNSPNTIRSGGSIADIAEHSPPKSQRAIWRCRRRRATEVNRLCTPSGHLVVVLRVADTLLHPPSSSLSTAILDVLFPAILDVVFPVIQRPSRPSTAASSALH